MSAMPRKCKFTESEVQFIMDNAYKGATWLAEQLQIPRAWIYQWGTDNGISVKRRDYPGRRKSSKNSHKWPRRYGKYKKLLVERDGLICHYCNSVMTYEQAQIDHIQPKVRGGSDAPVNLVLACPSCNHKKSTLCYSCPEFRDAITKVEIHA